MKAKRILAALTACGLCAMMVPLSAVQGVAADVKEVAETEYSGSCGEDMYWEFDENVGTLTISGTGKMESFYVEEDVPWYQLTGNILKIVIEDGVADIGYGAFEYCTSLTDVTIPDSVTVIDALAFRNCSCLKNITLPNNLTDIEDSAFSSCISLEKITIPDSVTSIGGSAFLHCLKLADITIPDSLTNFGIEPFEETAWQVAKQKENPLVIVNNVLIDAKSCTEEKVVIPDGVKAIGGRAFSTAISALTSVTVPESVESIGENAFYCCENLAEIRILNKDCDIFAVDDFISNGSTTICNKHEYDSSYHDSGIYTGTIYGYEGSTAQAYAEKYDYKFESLGAYTGNTTAPVETTTTVTTTTTTETTTATESTTTTEMTTTTENTTTETTTTTAETTTTTESTTATESTTEPTTTEAWYTSKEDFEAWAIQDYADKTGITAANAQAIENEDGKLSITLTDENGEVLDTYTINPVTGKGKDSAGNRVNLPQTGLTSPDTAVTTAGAAFLMLTGAALIGTTRKHRKNEAK